MTSGSRYHPDFLTFGFALWTFDTVHMVSSLFAVSSSVWHTQWWQYHSLGLFTLGPSEARRQTCKTSIDPSLYNSESHLGKDCKAAKKQWMDKWMFLGKRMLSVPCRVRWTTNQLDTGLIYMSSSSALAEVSYLSYQLKFVPFKDRRNLTLCYRIWHLSSWQPAWDTVCRSKNIVP